MLVIAQASKLAENSNAATQTLLVQLLPLFGCNQAGRVAYGSSIPLAAAARKQTSEAEQSGYWDLVYILYPDLLERLGAKLLRELVSDWPAIERALEVGDNILNTVPATASAGMQRILNYTVMRFLAGCTCCTR